MVFGLSVLNRVYNFKRFCPGSVLDRVWLQGCHLVFGNPKSETLVCIYFSEQCFTSIEFPLKVHRCYCEILGFFAITSRKSIILSVVISTRVSMRVTSRPVSDSGPLNVKTIANKHLRNTRGRSCPLS